MLYNLSVLISEANNCHFGSKETLWNYTKSQCGLNCHAVYRRPKVVLYRIKNENQFKVSVNPFKCVYRLSSYNVSLN